MIIIKNSEALASMRAAGRITAQALLVARDCVRPGISTKFLDTKIRRFIEKCGATPSFLGYNGFPAASCISVNEELIHGIPSDAKILREGDIVSVDVGAYYRGYHGDSARTFAVGAISKQAQKLISVTEASFYEGLRFAKAGCRLGDIGAAVEAFAVSNGYSIVTEYTGHGVGAALHEDPEVPNFGKAGHGARLYAGMTLAIEPMINEGTPCVKVQNNGWTVITADGKLSAHYENSIAITESDPIMLTDPDQDA